MSIEKIEKKEINCKKTFKTDNDVVIRVKYEIKS